MDWNYVKAVDLYVVFNSFVPPNGMIKSVAIYPTEFGLQRLKEENIHGPVLFHNENDISDEDINENMRAYQKSMMRFYHAVVECDSSTTAAHIYKECNGLDFLSTPLDLRFIPDFWEFKQESEDVVTEVPANYVVKDFGPRALQHSKVDFTWDDDDPLRKRTLRRKFTDEQLAQLEWKDYLASDASESDDNTEADDQLDEKARKQSIYLNLVYSGNGSDEDAEHDIGQEMEVTFHSGLESLNKKLMEKKDKETVWEASRRKRHEKKKAKKNKSKYSSDDDSDQQVIEAANEFIEEPSVKKRKKTEKSKTDNHMDIVAVDKASKEELELLLADDKATETGLKGYSLKFKKRKDKMGKENVIIDEGKVPNSTYSDDPRFAHFFSSPDYAIDPTDPQFKRSASYARQQLARKQKGQMELSVPKVMQMPSENAGNGMMEKDEKEGLLVFKSTKKDEDELSFLVKSVKMKSKHILNSKTRKDGKSQFDGVEKKRQH
ncbi:pre-rRNA-processing protein ESF1 [Medicago truncatula]|nr:pre-rRNA-processing protein ESF1-like [Medicago truncatula]